MSNMESDGTRKFREQPFSILVEKDDDLSSLRRTYAGKSKSERRKAADWEYHAGIAGNIFGNAMRMAGGKELGRQYWPEGVVSLAIDPLFAPAILTVGSIEYQLGRIKEAMQLFLSLTNLPEDEEDLSTIIDKAGDFLIDNEDFKNALALYDSAEKSYPNNSLYPTGSGYCLGKLGDTAGSVEKHRRAVALEPDNYKHLNDLGFSLLEAGQFEEAERILEKSISLSPDDYDFPRNNLKELKKRRLRVKG